MKRAQPSEQKIDALIGKMTLKEKVALLAGGDARHTMPIPRLS